MAPSIPENLENVRHLISQYEKKYARIPDSVQLLTVSKTHAAEKIMEACQAGQKHFGENYVQEALEKISTLNAYNLTWHFIGPVQSNKTRAIAENFHWVHSVDRLKIAQRLSDQRPKSLPPLNILLQVNISHEDSKAGVSLDELDTLARSCNELDNIVLSGLMAIPSPVKEFEQQRGSFHALREARDHLINQGIVSCQHLSMGMSNDFEAAIAEGATIIRIGTDIFGERG